MRTSKIISLFIIFITSLSYSMEHLTPSNTQSTAGTVNRAHQESVTILGSKITNILFCNLHHDSREKILSLRNALVNYRKINRDKSLAEHKEVLLNLLKTVKTPSLDLLSDSIALHIVEHYDLRLEQFDLRACKEFEHHPVLHHITKMAFLAYTVHIAQDNKDLQLASGCSIRELAEWGYFDKDRKPVSENTLDLHGHKIRYIE